MIRPVFYFGLGITLWGMHFQFDWAVSIGAGVICGQGLGEIIFVRKGNHE